jgi:acetylornithine deacetylase/succinyl-diaminopimelate desuccinylase family protein
MSETAHGLAAAVDAGRDELLELVTALVAFRTDSQSEDNPDFEPEARRCQAYLVSELERLGLEVQTWDHGGRYPVTVARLAGRGGGRSIALNGHVDVVPPGDPAAWTSDPWTATARDGRLYGRGTADMKAGVAAMIGAVRALREREVELAGDVWLHLVSDEEVVGRSTRELLTRLPRVDAVIDAEPTELALMPVEGGLIHLRVEVDGISAHAGNRYTLLHPGEAARGVSAVDKLLKIIAALQELERQWAKKPPHPMLPPGFATIMPGIVVGGPGGGSGGRLNTFSNAGTVPNYASAEYNIWYLPSETFEDVRAEIERHLHHASQLDPWLAEHPPRLTWKLNDIFFPPADTPPDHPLIRAFGDALGTLQRPAPVVGFNAASELAWYAEHSIPGTLFGPGAIAQAHGPDEFVPLDDVIVAAQAIALAVADYAGPAA